MFDPLKWVALADQLVEKGDEASIRTAIGRLYYACFLKNRDALIARGLMSARFDDADHRDVLRALQMNRRNAAADALHRMRLLRNRADYDTSEQLRLREWRLSRALADEVIRLCSPDWEA